MECLEIIEVSEDVMPFLLLGVEVLMCLFGGKPGFLFVITIKALGLYFDIGAVSEAQEQLEFFSDEHGGGSYVDIDTTVFELTINYVYFQRISAVVITIIVLVFTKFYFEPMLDVPESIEKKSSENPNKKVKWISAKRNLLFGSAWTGGDAISKLFSVSFKEDEDEDESTGADTQDGTDDNYKTDNATKPTDEESGKTDAALKKQSTKEDHRGCFGPGFYKLLQTTLGRIICFVLFLAIFILDVWFMFALLNSTTSYISSDIDLTISGVVCEISDDWILSIYWMVLSGLVGHMELWIIIFGIVGQFIGYIMYDSKGTKAPKSFKWIPFILSLLAMLVEIILVAIGLSDFASTYSEHYELFGDFKTDYGCG